MVETVADASPGVELDDRINFRHFPELDVGWAYAAFWGICLTLAGTMIGFFPRKGWLQGTWPLGAVASGIDFSCLRASEGGTAPLPLLPEGRRGS